jgi:hypothetical protein
VYPRVIAHNTQPLWARGRAGLARFGPGVKVGRLSTYGGWAGRGGSTRLHPESPRPSRHAATPGRSADHATFFSCVVRIRTRDPVFGPLPVGPQAVQGPADAFITQTPRGHALFMAHLGSEGERPDARGLAIGAWGLMQDMLELLTLGAVKVGTALLGRVECLAMHARPVVLKAWMTWRTVCTQQPTNCAIGCGDNPRVLASTIWARRMRQALVVRRSASNCLRSSSVTGRT